jgi:hypothetical protein
MSEAGIAYKTTELGDTPVTTAVPLPVTDIAAAASSAVLGAVTDAAVSTDANGTINAHIRGLVVLIVNFLSRLPAALAAGGGLKVEGVAGGVAQPVSAASGTYASGSIADGADVAQGVTTDAAVSTDANGTVNAHIRGLIVNAVALLARFPTVAALADATANPSLTWVGTFVHGFNGTTWDRIRTGAVANVAAVVGFISNIPAAIYNSSAPTITDGRWNALQIDVNANLKSTLATLIAGEDLTVGVLKVEERFSYKSVVTADVQVKGSAGFLHTVTISCNDAAPSAGSLIIYDSLTEAGTQVFNHTFTTTPFVPTTIILNYIMATGIYLGFATTADVNVSCSYR